MPDPFEVIGSIPDNVRYQWVTLTVEGQPTADRATMERNGWSAVPRERHPFMAVVGKEIIVGGQLLMEKSKELVDESYRQHEAAAIKAAEESERIFRNKVSEALADFGPVEDIKVSIKTSYDSQARSS